MQIFVPSPNGKYLALGMSDPFGAGTEPSQILVINDKGELHDRIILSNAPKHGAEVTDRDFVAKKGGVTTGSTKTAQVTLKAGETLTVKLVSTQRRATCGMCFPSTAPWSSRRMISRPGEPI